MTTRPRPVAPIAPLPDPPATRHRPRPARAPGEGWGASLRSLGLSLTLSLGLGLGLLPGPAAAQATLELLRGHARLLESPFDIGSVAVGDPGVLTVTAITPRRVLLNGARTGATSLMFFGKRGQVEEKRVFVVHDVTALREQLQRLDLRIRVDTDPNRNALVLSGTVRSEALRRRALDAALSFVGTVSYRIVENGAAVIRRGAVEASPAAGEGAEPGLEPGLPQLDDAPDLPGLDGSRNPEGGATGAAPAGPGAGAPQLPRVIGAAERGGEGSTVINRVRTVPADAPQIIDLLHSEEVLATRASQLEGLLAGIDPSLKVSEVNTVLHIRGSVANPTLHTRALALIENYVSEGAQTGNGLRPVADRGGVLVSPSDTQGTTRTGLGGGALRGGGIGGGGQVSASIGQSPPKGNIQQNLSRADAVVIANGRALGLIKVRSQPRVEVQIRIVAVDRDATDQLGINWRIDGSRVSIGNLTGNVVDELPTPNASRTFDAIDAGVANVVGAFRIGSSMSILAFLQAVQQNGAGTSLSEPLLTAVSGELVSFFVGGEIPLTTSTTAISTNSAIGGSTTTAQSSFNFRQFGVQLYLRPTVLEDGRISLVLDQSISAPDFSRTITLGGNLVPSFSQRQVQTLTETADGETWAVAGLVTAEDSERLQKVPLIGDLPILGKLFQNKNGRKARNELIITVTARQVPEAEPLRPAAGAAPPPTGAGEGAPASAQPGGRVTAGAAAAAAPAGPAPSPTAAAAPAGLPAPAASAARPAAAGPVAPSTDPVAPAPRGPWPQPPQPLSWRPR